MLGMAAVHRVAAPSASLGKMGELVTRHMPALTVYGVEVHDGCMQHDYPAMELLYMTDAYDYLLQSHFVAKAVYFPKTMRRLQEGENGEHRRLHVLWNARFVYAA